MRLTIDTCVIASAFRSRGGPSFALLRRFYEGHFEMAVSPALFLEYEAVLKRPEQCSVHGLSLDQLDVFLHDLQTRIIPTESRSRMRPQLLDPDDELVLECAINGKADALITFNVRDFLPAASGFQLPVLTPGSILKGGKSYGYRLPD